MIMKMTQILTNLGFRVFDGRESGDWWQKDLGKGKFLIAGGLTNEESGEAATDDTQVVSVQKINDGGEVLGEFLITVISGKG